MSDEIVPFRIEIPDAALEDLRDRLAQTRLPEPEPVHDWSQGTPLAYMAEIRSYWGDEYDWRATEARLNRLPQFRTEIDGLGIHFVHMPSPHEGARPLVLTHGWPGSIVEFDKVIEPLRDPPAHGGDASDAFHVVCPSLPGYGFSDRPRDTGWGVDRTAAAWSELMARLGYDHYFAQGGDWGAMVSSAMAMRDVNRVAGIHLNMPVVVPDPSIPMTDAEQAALANQARFMEWDAGYSRIQSTRPQTIGYALTDSPIGQAAWILEKFWSWTDTQAHPEEVLSRDDLLDNVMLYWLPANAASSARLYWESFDDLDMSPVAAPVGCSIFPGEIFRPSRRWAEERYLDLRYWGEPTRGGHFAAFEQPEIFVDEVRRCFRTMR